MHIRSPQVLFILAAFSLPMLGATNDTHSLLASAAVASTTTLRNDSSELTTSVDAELKHITTQIVVLEISPEPKAPEASPQAQPKPDYGAQPTPDGDNNKRLTELASTDPRAWLLLAGTYAQQHQYEKARDAFRHSYALGRSAEALVGLARTDFATKNYKETIQIFSALDCIAPTFTKDNPQVLYMLAQSYQVTGDKKGARDAYTRFLPYTKPGSQANVEVKTLIEELNDAAEARKRLTDIEGTPAEGLTSGPSSSTSSSPAPRSSSSPTTTAASVFTGPVAQSPADRVYLFSAIRGGNPDCVEQVLKLGADPNASYDGLQPLSYAAELGQTDVVKLLMGRGVDAQPSDQFPFTAIQYAAGRFNLDIVRFLLEKGVATPPPADVHDFMPDLSRYSDSGFVVAEIFTPVMSVISAANIALVEGDMDVLAGKRTSAREHFATGAEAWLAAGKHFEDVEAYYNHVLRKQRLLKGLNSAAEVGLSALQGASAAMSARQNAQIYALSHSTSMAQYTASSYTISQHLLSPTVGSSLGTAAASGTGTFVGAFMVPYKTGMEEDVKFLKDLYGSRARLARSFSMALQSSSACADGTSGSLDSCYVDIGKALAIK